MLYGKQYDPQSFEAWKWQCEQRAVEIMSQAPVFKVDSNDLIQVHCCKMIEIAAVEKPYENQANIKMCELAVHHRFDVRKQWIKVCVDRPLPSRLRDYYFLTFDNEASKDAFMKRIGFSIV